MTRAGDESSGPVVEEPLWPWSFDPATHDVDVPVPGGARVGEPPGVIHFGPSLYVVDRGRWIRRFDSVDGVLHEVNLLAARFEKREDRERSEHLVSEHDAAQVGVLLAPPV